MSTLLALYTIPRTRTVVPRQRKDAVICRGDVLARRICWRCLAVLIVVCSAVARADELSSAVIEAAVPPGAVMRLGSLRFRHGDWIQRVSFTPDGEHIVSGGWGRYRVWAADGGRRVSELILPDRSKASYDGDRLVLIAERIRGGVPKQQFRIVNLFSGDETATFVYGQSTISMAICRGGRLTAVANGDWSISLVDPRTGKTTDTLPSLPERSNRASYPVVTFSPGGKTLAIRTSTKRIRFHEVTEAGAFGRRLETLATTDGYIESFSPKADMVAVAGKGATVVRNVRTGERIGRVVHDNRYSYVPRTVFSPDGQWLAGHFSDIRIWDFTSGKVVKQIETVGSFRLDTLAFSSDNQSIVGGSSLGRVRRWDVATGWELFFDASREVLGPIESVAISGDGQWIASAEAKGVVSLWSLSGTRQRAVLKDDDVGSKLRFDTQPGPNFVTFTPDSRHLIAGSGDRHNSVNIWDVRTCQRTSRFEGHGMPILGVACSADGSVIASSSRDRTIRVWSRAGSEQVKIGAAGPLALAPDGGCIAVGILRENHDAENGIPVPVLPSPVIQLWDPRTGRLVKELQNHSEVVHSLTFSPDGKRLASSSADLTIRIWDVASGTCLHVLPAKENPHRAFVNERGHRDIAYSPRTHVIASGDREGAVHLWDAETGARLVKLTGHDGPVRCVAWQRNGERLVSGGVDSTVIVWDVKRVLDD
jgi:WD40 repeat protein